MTSSALSPTEWDSYAFGLQVLGVNRSQKSPLGGPATVPAGRGECWPWRLSGSGAGDT